MDYTVTTQSRTGSDAKHLQVIEVAGGQGWNRTSDTRIFSPQGLLIGGKLFGLLGVILAIPAIAIAKVFFKFLRELYQASHFYHAGDLHPDDAPSEKIEERIADAAETVIAEQQQKDVDEAGETTAATGEIPAIIEKPV